MGVVNGPVRPVGAGDYQPPRKRASADEPQHGRPLSMADQLEALRGWVSERNARPLDDDQPARKLAHGIDTLYATLEVDWVDRTGESSEPRLWAILDDARARAAGDHDDQIGTAEEGQRNEHGCLVVIPVGVGWGDLYVNVMPNGASGYRWLLRGHGIVLKIGRELKAKSRPNVMIELGSDACWRHGAREVLMMVEKLVRRHGGTVVGSKPSRVDMCVDLLVPDDTIYRSMDQKLVTYARSYAVHADIRKPVHGVTVGSGEVMLRMYDKPKEIADRGGVKVWMYDVWGIEPGDPRRVDYVTPRGREVMQRLDANVPEGHRVIRVEFQLRREALKELGAVSMENLIERAPSIWRYLTGDWCRFVNRPDVKRDRQKLLGWWSVVQGSWPKAWASVTAVRAPRPSRDKQLLARGAMGYLSSLLAACRAGQGGPDDLTDANFHAAVRLLRAEIEKLREDPDDLTADVLDKVTRYDKGVAKLADAIMLRRAADRRAWFERDEQAERTIRVEDGSAEVSRSMFRRQAMAEEVDAELQLRKAMQVLGEKQRLETLTRPKIEQLKIGY